MSRVEKYLISFTIEILISFLVLGFFCSHLYAEDYYLEKHNETFIDGKPVAGISVIKLWVTDNAIRHHNSSDKDNALIIHMDEDKIYKVNDRDKTVQEQNIIEKSQSEDAETKITSKRTNEKKKLGEWDTFQVILTTSYKEISSEAEFWLSEDITLSLTTRMRLTKYFGGRKILEELKKYSGYPVEMIVHLKVEGKEIDIVTRLIKLEKEVLDKSLFSVPADYKRIQLPDSVKGEGVLP